jgi:xanthine dehydrogenase/oxidase
MENALLNADDLRLTGAKLGCGVGGCGSCTVLVSSVSQNGSEELVHRSVTACLCPLYAVEGMHVVTVEGLGSTVKGLHPLQKSLANSHGTQCGFCSPGFIMSMYALLRSKGRGKVTEEEIQDALAGNLWYVLVSIFTVLEWCSTNNKTKQNMN